MKTLGARLYWKDAVGYQHHKTHLKDDGLALDNKGGKMHHVLVPQLGVWSQQVVGQSKWYVSIGNTSWVW
jgi:hypothetical protein